MHSFGVPTNGWPWNLSSTKAGSGRSSSSWGPWCQQRIRWRWWRQQVDQVDSVIKLNLQHYILESLTWIAQLIRTMMRIHGTQF
jgi:hypothetical protein